jgi:phytoene dehydrogenase-like protein
MTPITERLVPPLSESPVDAIVIGAGPNGLVAANILCDAGWSVRVFEAAPTAGGAVRTEELTLPQFHHDTMSCFYPLAQLSPALRNLNLSDYGLRWCHAPISLAHVGRSTPTGVIHRDPVNTASGFELLSAGDGPKWLHLASAWARHRELITAALFRPFPPVNAAMRLLMYPTALRGLPRFAALSMRRFAEEQFSGAAPQTLLMGSTLHTDVSPEGAGSAMFGCLLTLLAQDVGFPVPAGGAQLLISALTKRLAAGQGDLHLGTRVDRITVHAGTATGVVTNDGIHHNAHRAVIADTDAVVLAQGLLRDVDAANGMRKRVTRFQRDYATIKVDWALAGRTPWSDDRLNDAATVHLGSSSLSMSVQAAELSGGRIPHDPFVIIGQPSVADPSRAPAGCQTLWAYTHVPVRVLSSGVPRVEGRWDRGDLQRMADHLEAMIEQVAPGFSSRILARHVMGPIELANRNENLIDGGLGGGSANLHQQLMFRPVTTFGRSGTPITGLFVGSASAHPGAGVHGGPGANAAYGALARDRTVSGLFTRRRMHRTVFGASEGDDDMR